MVQLMDWWVTVAVAGVGILLLERSLLRRLIKWLDHWTYARSLTRCDHCGKRAFCYYGVCLDIGNGKGNFCGMGCPDCKKVEAEERARKIEQIEFDGRKFVEVKAPTPNRRAAVMATRRRRAEIQG